MEADLDDSCTKYARMEEKREEEEYKWAAIRFDSIYRISMYENCQRATFVSHLSFWGHEGVPVR